MPLWTEASNRSGWNRDQVNDRLDFGYKGTRAGHISVTTGNIAFINAATVTGLLTASAAITVTTGNLTVSAGDYRGTGNARLGVVSAFGTTEPTSALVMKSGTAYAGAITTSGGIQSTDTVVTKIIAAGTVTNVET